MFLFVALYGIVFADGNHRIGKGEHERYEN